MAEVMGWQHYVKMTKESTWGTYDSGGTHILIPYNTYGVAVQNQVQNATPYIGIRQRKHSRISRATLSGNLDTFAWAQQVSSKSLAQHLIEAAFSAPSGVDLDSWTADMYDGGNDDKRHVGLRVNTLTISGSETADAINMSVAFQGKQETGGVTNPALSSSEPPLSEFLFSDVLFYLSDEATASSATADDEALQLRDFTLTINNNLVVKNTNSFWPTIIKAGLRTVDFSFSFYKTDNTYDALRRTSDQADRTARLILKGAHLGTGSDDLSVIEFQFDRLNFAGATDQMALNDLDAQSVNWVTLKPDTSSQDVDIIYSTEAA